MIIKIIIFITNPNFNSNLFNLSKKNIKKKIPFYVIKLFIIKRQINIYFIY